MVLDIKKVLHGKLEITAQFPNISLDSLNIIEVDRVDVEVVQVEGIEGGMSGGATDIDEGRDTIVNEVMGDHAIKGRGEGVGDRNRKGVKGDRDNCNRIRVRVRVHRKRARVVRENVTELGEELGEDSIEKANIK